MRKVKRLMILGLCLTSCSNPNNVVNTNPTPNPTISISTSITPIPSISSSVNSSSPTPSGSISPMPSLAPTPTPSVYENPNAIKKVELYSGINNYLFPIDESRIYKSVANNDYYDLKPYAKITYNDGRSEDKEIILESSNKEIAHIQNNVLYIHSKDNKSGFNLIIQEKETTKEIASYKLELGGSEKLTPLQLVMLSGKIYDTEGNNIKDAKISLKCLDLPVESDNKYILIEQPKYGEFKLDYIISGIKFEMEVSKEGYKTVTRRFILKGLSLFQEMNFGGTNEEDKPYAMEKL